MVSVRVTQTGNPSGTYATIADNYYHVNFRLTRRRKEEREKKN
jgi:hypothetical protein